MEGSKSLIEFSGSVCPRLNANLKSSGSDELGYTASVELRPKPLFDKLMNLYPKAIRFIGGMAARFIGNKSTEEIEAIDSAVPSFCPIQGVEITASRAGGVSTFENQVLACVASMASAAVCVTSSICPKCPISTTGCNDEEALKSGERFFQ